MPVNQVKDLQNVSEKSIPKKGSTFANEFKYSISPSLKLQEFIESQNKHTIKDLIEGSQNFRKSSLSVANEINKFYDFLGSVTLINVILMWGRQIENDSVFGRQHIDLMKKLLEAEIIQYRTSKGEYLSLESYVQNGHDSVIDSIRCFRDWSIDKQEEFVTFYIGFVDWLVGSTFGFVAKVEDPDRVITARRKISFEMYIKMIKELSFRERILVKLFYLGGTKSQDEVLSLRVEDVNFSDCSLKIGDEVFVYPRHVIQDINDFIGDQKKGYVFTNKAGDKIDHTVPYRAFKTVTSKLNLESLSFKDLMTNI